MLGSDPKVDQQTNFIVNLDRTLNTTIFFFIEKGKVTILNFSEGTMKELLTHFTLI